VLSTGSVHASTEIAETIYSLLKAVIGDNLDAFHAVYRPAAILIPTEISHTEARSVGRKTGVILDKICAGPPPTPPPEVNKSIRK
jgi:hypothetical protein